MLKGKKRSLDTGLSSDYLKKKLNQTGNSRTQNLQDTKSQTMKSSFKNRSLKKRLSQLKDPNSTASFAHKSQDTRKRPNSSFHVRPASASANSTKINNTDRRHMSSFLKYANQEMLRYDDAKVLMSELDSVPDINPSDIQSALKVMKLLQVMKKQKPEYQQKREPSGD